MYKDRLDLKSSMTLLSNFISWSNLSKMLTFSQISFNDSFDKLSTVFIRFKWRNLCFSCTSVTRISDFITRDILILIIGISCHIVLLSSIRLFGPLYLKRFVWWHVSIAGIELNYYSHVRCFHYTNLIRSKLVRQIPTTRRNIFSSPPMI